MFELDGNPHRENSNEDNIARQKRFYLALRLVCKMQDRQSPCHSLQKDLIDATSVLMQNVVTNDERKAQNNKFVAYAYRVVFATHYSRKALAWVFGKVYNMIELDEKEGSKMYNTLKGFNIKVSDEVKEKFNPLNIREKNLINKAFATPNYKNIAEYIDFCVKNSTLEKEARIVLGLLEKSKKISVPKARQLSIFGQTTNFYSGAHKKNVGLVLGAYKNNVVHKGFFGAIIEQTNFSDEEAYKLKQDFSDCEDIIDEKVKARRSKDIGRLNGYITRVCQEETKDKLAFVSHRSVYLSMLYKSLIKGEDIDNVDLADEFILQRNYLKNDMLRNIKETSEGKDDKTKWAIAKNRVHKLMATNDTQKIEAIEKYIQSSPYIDNESYEVNLMDANLVSLRGDKNNLNYSIRRFLYHFER